MARASFVAATTISPPKSSMKMRLKPDWMTRGGRDRKRRTSRISLRWVSTYPALKCYLWSLFHQRERLEKLRQQAEELTEQRKRAREEAHKWTLESKDSDDEKEPKKTKKPRGRARPEAGLSGDEGEPRKKRRAGKLRKDGEGAEDDGALFSGEEDGENKPAARKVCVFAYTPCTHVLISCLQRTKKRVVRDDDEEEATAPRKKQMYVCLIFSRPLFLC